MSIKRLFPGVRLLHHSVYTDYRKTKKVAASRKVKGREEVRKILDCICKHVGQGIVDTPGGVLLDGVGYFFIWKVPRKMQYFSIRPGEDGGLKENYNFHTGHYMYLPTFIPTKPKASVLQGWGMDKTFHSGIKKGVANKLKNGTQYQMYAHTLKQI